MTQTSLRARWVVPVALPPIASGVVTIEGERIVSVGQACYGQEIDLGDVVLMPGLVNAHTHLEFSDCQKPLGRAGMALPEWIRQVIGMRHRSDRDPAAAISLGLNESLHAGVTTVGEISTTSTSAYGEFSGSQLLAFQEVIGFSAARCDSVQGDLEDRVDATLEKHLDVGISPHAPYTVHPELLQRLIDSAVARKLPVAMHLAESLEELELLRDNTGPFQQLLADRSMWDPEAIPLGSKPLDYLRVLSQAPRSLVIHGNYLSHEEITFLGENRETMSVVYCPRTHAFFGHSAYPLQQMLDAGVRVALGTDSRASNPDLNMLSEMRCVEKQFPHISPEAILQMGTLWGAEGLGLSHEVGTLEPGKLADLVAIPCPASDDPLSTILHGSELPTHVFVRGNQVVAAQ
jgi:cytosine/adenosine deaminase-related metal-dependent hydrolase